MKCSEIALNTKFKNTKHFGKFFAEKKNIF